ncbi:ferrochelatase [Niveispirillum fermenti]|uniref:ferrochelatase n=1 Tax=Niveispirillum fermenti TaxID=1233113 RepID=UPI003A8C3585
MALSVRRDRIAIVLVQPGQPAGQDQVQAYFMALMAARRVRPPSPLASPPVRALQAIRARHLARHYPVGDAQDADDPMATALEGALWEEGALRIFAASLFAPPSAVAIAHDVALFQPDRIIVVPPSSLFSGGLNGLAIDAWQQAARQAGLMAPASILCCHPTDPALLRRLADRAARALATADPAGRAMLMLVAPGMGRAKDDPLGWQMRRLADELARLLNLPAAQVLATHLPVPGFTGGGLPAIDHVLRGVRAAGLAILPVTPRPLLRPAWADFLPGWQERAGRAGVISLSLETETDLDGADLAPLIRQALAGRPGICAGFGQRFCPAGQDHCPHRRMAVAAMQHAVGA